MIHLCFSVSFFYFFSVPTNVLTGPGSPWGPVELVAIIAGPVFLLCVLLMVGVFLWQYHQRAYSHRQRLEVEDPSCDHLYLAKDKTLQDLIYDMSTSGSGSGQYMLTMWCDEKLFSEKKNVFLDKYPPIPVSRSSSVTVLL